jgi:RNA polymerase sigma-70 factor, ECF subfamily
MNAHVANFHWTTGSCPAWPLELPVRLRALWAAAASGPARPAVHGCLCATSRQPATLAADGQATDAPDEDLVRRSLLGDHDAYAQLIRRYQQPIAAYLWRFTTDRTAWEELTHEVFVEAYLALATYRARAPLLHWLKRIATRVGYRYWKQRQRQRRSLSLDALSDAPVALAAGNTSPAEAHELVHRLLDCMAPRDRLVLTLTYLESHSTAEIAALTGWSRSMIKVQLHRARKRLARITQAMGIQW